MCTLTYMVYTQSQMDKLQQTLSGCELREQTYRASLETSEARLLECLEQIEQEKKQRQKAEEMVQVLKDQYQQMCAATENDKAAVKRAFDAQVIFLYSLFLVCECVFELKYHAMSPCTRDSRRSNFVSVSRRSKPCCEER